MNFRNNLEGNKFNGIGLGRNLNLACLFAQRLQNLPDSIRQLLRTEVRPTIIKYPPCFVIAAIVRQAKKAC